MPKGINKFGTHTERTLKGVDINSREKLQKLAEEEHVNINWELWDKLVTKTKQDIAKELKEYHKPQYTNTVFVYSIQKQQVIRIFNTPQDCANYYNIARETVTNYMRENRIYYKLGIQFRTNV